MTRPDAPTCPPRRRWWPLAAAAAFALAPATARAQTYTWNSNTSGNLSDGTRYYLTGAPPAGGGAATTLQFFVAPTTTVTATDDLAGAFVLNQFQFYNNGSSPLTVTATANSLAFDGAAPGVTILGNAGGSTGATVATPVALNAATTVGGPGLSNLQFTNTVSGAGGLVIAGGAPTFNTRVVSLTGANTFTGGVVLTGGNLSVGSASALGGTGAALNVTGSSSLTTTSAVTLAASANLAAGSTLNLLGTSALTFGSGNVIGGSGNLVTRNTSGLVVQSMSTLSGTVSADVSPLAFISTAPAAVTLSGLNGSLANVPTFNIASGGSLVLTSNTTGTTNADRIGNAAAVNLRAAGLTLTGAFAGGALTETYGALTGAGYSTVTAAAGTTAGATTLAGASLARADRGTFLFRGTTLGTAGNSGFVTFAAAPALVGGGGAAGSTNVSIIPYAVGDTSAAGTGTSFVTYDPALGVRPLSTATEYAASLTTGAADANVRLTASTANAAAVTVNSLAQTAAVTGAGTITVTSGAVLTTGAANSNNLAFGAAEGQIFNTSSATFSGNLTGTNGLTKSGGGTLTLSGTNTGLTGQLTINNSLLSVAAAGNLPGTGQIVATGTAGQSTTAGITYTGTTPLTIARDIAVTSGTFNPVAANSAGPLTLSGVISGAGGLYVSTTGDVILTGANTYTGPTRVYTNNVVISSDSNLGNGGMFDFGANSTTGVVLNGNWTTSRPINYSFSSLLNTNANTAVWNGPVTGTSSLYKGGTGSLQVNSASPFSGSVIVNANGGEVRLGQNGSLGSTTYSLASGTALTLDNAALPTGPAPPGYTVDRVADGATVSLTSATLRSVGNSGAAASEFIGTVSAIGAGNVLELLASGGQNNALRVGNLSVGTASLLVRGTNLGATAGGAGQLFLNQFNGAAVTSGQFLTNVTAQNLANPGVIDNAVYDAAVGVRLAQASDFTTGTLIQNAAPTSTPTAANFRVTTATTAPSGANTDTADAANTIASLRLGSGANLNAASGTLTVSTGNVLTEAGALPASVTGGTLTAGSTLLAVGTNSDLTVSSAVAGTGGLAKNGAGALTLTGALTNTGALTLNAGTLSLNGPSVASSSLTVNAGTLNLGAPASSTAITVNAGTLYLGAAPTAAPALAVAAGATAVLSGVSPTLGNLTGAGTLNVGANTLTTTGTSGNFTGQLVGTGALAYNPASAALLTLGGNNGSFSGPVTGNANARFVAGSSTAFGTGAVNLSAQTASSTAGTPTLGFNFGAVGASGTIANNIAFTSAGVSVFIAQNNSSFAGQTLTLSGVLSGGSAATVFALDESGVSRANVVRFTNPNNTLAGTIATPYSTLAVTSDAALGNVTGVTLSSTSAQANGGLRFDANNITLAATRPVSVTGAGASINTNGNSATVAGVVSGSTNLAKTGAGTLALTAANTYTGALTVSAGTLLVNGSLAGAATPAALTVSSGATLGGTGTIGATGATRAVSVAAGGAVRGGTPGTAGTLTVNGTTAVAAATGGGGGRLQVEAGNTAGNNSVLAVSGNLSFTGLATGTPTASDAKFGIDVVSSAADPLVLGNSYTLTLATAGAVLRNTTAVTGTFDPNDYTLTSASFPGFANVSLVSTGTALQLTFTPVPEPSSVVAVAAAGAGLAGLVRRRRRAAASPTAAA